ncbi:photosystem reaction center subunit H [Clostridium estertheticum]|uniref:Photosystem reaction center subunit H n=2 Tax=Clostridium estertheticum TaxID=238834 RepID=A0A5N7J1U3_9CLOT|nr:PRC-barrel domain-containing protein [Clostridium estertheticum]MPQ32019.1 photosystem reaction center subunit H [Clostridium estertheticum]MPQ62678.1 photosystem reaction center subunit H [Clostridium estertheticum]
MFKSKDFIFMNVVSVDGKKIGFIKDLLIDFNKGKVIGFLISPYNFFQKNLSVLKEDIIYFNKDMVVKKVEKSTHLCLHSFISMDVIDICKNVLGMVEDITFTGNNFIIKGVIVSSGFITNLLRGKRIILINELILGEENILYIPNHDQYCFKSMPHNFFVQGKSNEKNQ